jgi:hypothetical protein
VEVQSPYGCCLVERAGSKMKRLLRAISEKVAFKHEELLTILDNNEAVINTQPLTDLCDNLLSQCLLKIFQQQVFQICTTPG